MPQFPSSEVQACLTTGRFYIQFLPFRFDLAEKNLKLFLRFLQSVQLSLTIIVVLTGRLILYVKAS